MGMKTSELYTRQGYLVSTVSNDRVRSILVCSRQYRVKVCEVGAIKLNCVLVNVKIRNRVLTEVGGKYESVLTLAAGKRIPGASDQNRFALP
jgi:hypothetical protein